MLQVILIEFKVLRGTSKDRMKPQFYLTSDPLMDTDKYQLSPAEKLVIFSLVVIRERPMNAYINAMERFFFFWCLSEYGQKNDYCE